ncbi:MAG TPA: MHYT domain-containing protein [Fontimonas sp.]
MNTSYLSGTYDIALVWVSYLIACLAAYAAIDMVQRIRDNREHERRWLLLGAVMLGCGIWTMHFIGMQSFSLPFELNYDTGKTVLSLIAAIAVALLALWASSRNAMGLKAVVAGAFLMGIGICAMHYIGMYAMEIRPGIDWNLSLVAASAVIAVVASGAALWLLFNLPRVSRRYWLAARLGAALIMGVAVVGMHYTGMAAANFPVGSSCAVVGGLGGSWMTYPLATIASATTLIILALSAFDVRYQARLKEQNRQAELEQRARILALYDERTMMRNRASFQQEIVAWIQSCDQHQQSFDLFHCALKFAGAANDEHVEIAMRDIAERIRPRLRDTDILARFNKTEFIVLRKREHSADLPQRLHDQLHVISSQPIERSDVRILPEPQLGSAQFPNDGRHSRTLLQVAQRQAMPSVELRLVQRVA